MNIIELDYLELKTFSEQDASDYCLLNNINPDNIIKLRLQDNKLTDISGIKVFKNIEFLWLYNNNITNISAVKYLTKLESLNIGNNQITDISTVKYLTKLKELSISNLELESDQIKYINKCKNLEKIWCRNTFKNMSVLNQLNKNLKVIK